MAQDTNRFGSLYSRLPTNEVATKDGRSYEHRVPTRDERRVLLEVEVSPTNGTVIGGQHCKQGKHRLVVYASEVPAVEAMVATTEQKAAWAKAEDTFRRQRDRWLANHIGKDDGTETWRIKRERHLAMFGETSAAVEFARDFPTGRPPLDSCRVVEELGAPETESNRDAKRLEGLITQLVEGLGRAVAGKSSGKNATG